METARRSLVKAGIWNGIGLCMMALVGLVMTGSAALGGQMALFNTVLGFLCYLLYERIWARIGWGRDRG
ncbi:DUF2061 domain-containing protein [Roseovarius aestuariivivens]|uniref:DUF2061 domain-containing protein n=1 Tax=Roseovarius aestuariivivens TaxID=1888910 RepID=UPI00108111C8|nr:DUF2061 domain-containing protein [Roseovarius aestuariivivens]